MANILTAMVSAQIPAKLETSPPSELTKDGVLTLPEQTKVRNYFTSVELKMGQDIVVREIEKEKPEADDYRRTLMRKARNIQLALMGVSGRVADTAAMGVWQEIQDEMARRDFPDEYIATGLDMTPIGFDWDSELRSAKSVKIHFLALTDRSTKGVGRTGDKDGGTSKNYHSANLKKYYGTELGLTEWLKNEELLVGDYVVDYQPSVDVKPYGGTEKIYGVYRIEAETRIAKWGVGNWDDDAYRVSLYLVKATGSATYASGSGFAQVSWNNGKPSIEQTGTGEKKTLYMWMETSWSISEWVDKYTDMLVSLFLDLAGYVFDVLGTAITPLKAFAGLFHAQAEYVRIYGTGGGLGALKALVGLAGFDDPDFYPLLAANMAGAFFGKAAEQAVKSGFDIALYGKAPQEALIGMGKGAISQYRGAILDGVDITEYVPNLDTLTESAALQTVKDVYMEGKTIVDKVGSVAKANTYFQQFKSYYNEIEDVYDYAMDVASNIRNYPRELLKSVAPGLEENPYAELLVGARNIAEGTVEQMEANPKDIVTSLLPETSLLRDWRQYTDVVKSTSLQSGLQEIYRMGSGVMNAKAGSEQIRQILGSTRAIPYTELAYDKMKEYASFVTNQKVVPTNLLKSLSQI
jgi:hypothetical protein